MVFKTACTGSIPVIFDISIINNYTETLTTDLPNYDVKRVNILNEIKPTTYFKVDKKFRSSRIHPNLNDWVKLKINKKAARRKLNEAKRKSLIKPSIFGGGRTLHGIVIKRPAKFISNPMREKFVGRVIRKLSFFGTNTASRRLIYRLSKKIKRKDPTKYRLYRKEIVDRHNTFEMNQFQAVFQKLNRYRVKKNPTQRLVFFNKYLNTRAGTYFKKYLSRASAISSLLNGREILTNDWTTKTALLLQPLCKSADFRSLLFKVDRFGLRDRTLKRVLKLTLNPLLIDFTTNKDTLTVTDNLIADYFTTNLLNQTDNNLHSSRYTSIGHSWSCKSDSYHYNDSTTAYVEIFWDSLNFDFTKNSVKVLHTSLKYHSDLINFFQNTVLTDFIKLNIVKNFAYKSYLFNTLTKSSMLSDSLLPSYSNLNYSTVASKSMFTKFTQYSCFRSIGQSPKVLRSSKTTNMSTNSSLYNYLGADVVAINSPTKTEQVLTVTTKVPTQYVGTNIGSIDIQLGTNQECFNDERIGLNEETTSCPTVFTLKLNVSDYLSEQLFITYANNNEGNDFIKYHYTETNEPTMNLHTANNFVQTPFLINWNENISENLAYLQPVVTTDRLNVEDKLISILTSFKGLANDDALSAVTNFNQIYSTDKISTVPGSNLVINQSNINLKIRNKQYKKLFRSLNTTLKSFINQIGVFKNTTFLSELIKDEAETQHHLINILNMLKRRYGVRGSILKFNTEFASFILKPACKIWLSKRMSRRLGKLSTIKKKKKYLLFDKKKNRKRNPKFYNKVVRMESEPIKNKLKKGTKVIKYRQYLKKYINYSSVSKWARNVNFYKKSFSIFRKNFKINQLEVLEAEPADLISNFDDYVDEFKSLSELPDFSDFNDNSEFATSDYISWLLDHRARNVITTSLQAKIERRKSYNVVSTSSEDPHHLLNYKSSDLTSYLTSNMFFLNTILTNQFLFKYLITRSAEYYNYSHFNITFKLAKPILYVLNLFYFGSRFELLYRSNLFPTESFSYLIQRRLLKCFALRKFISSTGAWYNHMLVRFMSNCTGRKVYLKLNPHVENNLTFEDRAQCVIWENRVLGFQKILGPRIFIEESLRIILIALKYKDPTFLINWIRTMLYRMSFWKYRTLFRYLKFVIKDLFEPNFEKFGLRGFKVKLKGKISVAGNARTRTLLMRVGQTSHSKFNNKVAHSFTLVNSFTGVMGFNLWIFF